MYMHLAGVSLLRERVQSDYTQRTGGTEAATSWKLCDPQQQQQVSKPKGIISGVSSRDKHPTRRASTSNDSSRGIRNYPEAPKASFRRIPACQQETRRARNLKMTVHTTLKNHRRKHSKLILVK